MQSISFSILKIFPSMRIEAVLREVFPEFSRAKWKVQVDKGEVRVSGKTVRAGHQVSLNDLIEAALPRTFSPGPERLSLGAEELRILFEDESLIAVSKPRGMHSILQRENDPVTVADLVVALDRECLYASKSILDGGLVQRLDFYTSGVCLAAKSRADWDNLHQQFVNKEVTKDYVAKVIKGITLKDLSNSTVFTKAEILSSEAEFSQVRVSLADGSRHIVRREFRNLGFPLVGDVEYGKEMTDLGFYLHAESVTFKHPRSGEEMIVKDGV